MPLLKHDIRNRGPLLLGRVYASGVVRTGMQEKDRAWNGIVQSPEETFIVETYCGRMVVRVVDGCDTNVLEYRVMVGYVK